MGFPKVSNKTKLEWKRKVEECNRSGKSIMEWCRENGVVYTTFLGWRNKFQKKSKSSNQKSSNSFIEIPEETNRSSTIEIEWKGAKIKVTKDSDFSLLKQFLQAIKDL